MWWSFAVILASMIDRIKIGETRREPIGANGKKKV